MPLNPGSAAGKYSRKGIDNPGNTTRESDPNWRFGINTRTGILV